jgi:hypothetical protein
VAKSREEYLKQYRQDTLEKTRIRSRKWYLEHKARAIARTRAWELTHPERVKHFKRSWEAKNKIACPICSRRMDPMSKACIRCLCSYGHMCVKNPNCGVVARHKHCPCGLPITQPTSTLRVIEFCPHCLADRARGACMKYDYRDMRVAA